MYYHNMKNLFEETNEELIEKFEIIFDRAKNETAAKTNAVDYYLCLVEEGKSFDPEQIIEVAENYGYDFSNFIDLVKENM